MSTNKEHLAYINKENFRMECSNSIFSPQEIEVIEKCGHWFTALTDGSLNPLNAKQKQFVEVSENLRGPTTDYEKVWWKYLKRKEIEAKYGNTLYTNPNPEQDTFHSRDMAKNLKSMMFKVTKENHKK
jgi:uncharacterized protein YifE (UPF0438 family)